MKFVTNTKPLADSLNLGIINANVSNFHKKSCIAQISATKDTLVVNLEAARICSEIKLKGSGDSDEPVTIFVSSLLIKQLVSTFETSTTTLEFTDNGLILHSGSSKFTLPKMVDASELELDSPSLPEYNSPEIDIDKSDWKFIKDFQMYAIAMSFIHPVYTRVWVGSDGDVIVGDFDNSLFTHSVKSKLGKTCLLSDTIINLFNSLPDGAKLVSVGDSYIIRYKSDSFEYVSQFTPQYESDENIGSYNSDIFLSIMDHPDKGMTVSAAALTKFLNQSALLAGSEDDTVTVSVTGDTIQFKDRNVDCRLKADSVGSEDFSVDFKSESLRKVISNYEDDNINIIPVHQDGEVSGILVWNKDVTTILSSVEG